MGVRLHKHLAACGAGSRRKCEQLMRDGRVTVDGVQVTEPGVIIDPATADVKVDGRKVVPAALVYLALHKPPGHVCTSSDPRGRLKAVDLVPRDKGRLYTVGRLDAASEGLILLTNDGEFAHRMMHPRHGITKTYELWLTEPLSPLDVRRWRAGIEDGGENLAVLELEAFASGKAGHGYRVRLGEGRNRHLRRMAACSGKKVCRLVRVAVGPVALGNLKRGAWRVLTSTELDALRRASSPAPGGAV